MNEQDLPSQKGVPRRSRLCSEEGVRPVGDADETMSGSAYQEFEAEFSPDHWSGETAAGEATDCGLGMADGGSAPSDNPRSAIRNPQSGEPVSCVVESDVGAQVQALVEEYLQSGVQDASPERLNAQDQHHRTPGYSPKEGWVSPDRLREAICEAMAPLVESIARRYAGSSNEPLEDLVSEGYVGLLTAIDLYRADRGARFSTYATHRVHGQIRHYLRDRSNRRLIRAPSWLQELTGRLRREEARLSAELGRPPTLAELAEQMNLKEEAVEELQAHLNAPAVLSLAEGGGQDEESGSVDLSKIRSQHYVSWQLPVEDRIFLEGMMVRLKELERKVITLFFFHDFNQTEIARSMNISCNYVGYLLKNALGKLRRQIEADELKDALASVRYTPQQISGDASIIDAATGLYNVDYFRTRLAEEVARACRYGHELAIVVVRVPLPAEGMPQGGSTKGTKGHEGETADDDSTTQALIAPKKRRKPDLLRGPSWTSMDRATLLRELGVALRDNLRKADIPARIEEGTLAVLLPHTGDGAAAAAARISDLVSRVVGDEGITLTGTAIYPVDGRKPSALLEMAADRCEGLEQPCMATDPVPILA